VLPHLYRRFGLRQLVHQSDLQLPEDAGLCVRCRQDLSELARRVHSFAGRESKDTPSAFC